MVRELERAGIPVAHVCTMINVAKGMGSNRMVPSRSVLYPTGDPELSITEEFKLRQQIIKSALEAVQTEIVEPKIIEIR